MNITALTELEQLYLYPQPTDISHIVGSIGRLRVDFDTNGMGFFTSWDDHLDMLKTQGFQTEFGEVVDWLRKDPSHGRLLQNRQHLSRFCATHGFCQVEPNTYGIRVDTAQYSYLCRLDPQQGAYNGYIYCYQKEWLNTHLKECVKGIVLPTGKDEEPFKMTDNTLLEITAVDGTKTREVCRYMDEHHMVMGNSIHHINTFATWMRTIGSTYAPVSTSAPKEKLSVLERLQAKPEPRKSAPQKPKEVER